MKLGMIGLGKMGFGMSERLLEGGLQVVGFDLDPTKAQDLRALGGEAANSLDQVVAALPSPRVLWMMLTDTAVEATLASLADLLAPGDCVVDGGNSRYTKTQERAASLAERGIHYIDVGTSGGVWGRQEGYCLMIGGDRDAVAHLEPLFKTLAPAADRGWGRVGPPGAGHYVKMVHNAIEYGLMQAYAEGFSLLEKKNDLQLDLSQICDLWGHGSVVRSWLLELMGNVLAQDQTLEDVEAWVPDSGLGRWAAMEAIDLEVPAPVIAQSLSARFASRGGGDFGHKLLATLRHQFGGHAVRKRAATESDD